MASCRWEFGDTSDSSEEEGELAVVKSCHELKKRMYRQNRVDQNRRISIDPFGPLQDDEITAEEVIKVIGMPPPASGYRLRRYSSFEGPEYQNCTRVDVLPYLLKGLLVRPFEHSNFYTIRISQDLRTFHLDIPFLLHHGRILRLKEHHLEINICDILSIKPDTFNSKAMLLKLDKENSLSKAFDIDALELEASNEDSAVILINSTLELIGLELRGFLPQTRSLFIPMKVPL